jgi:hypothetical protein
MKRSRIAVVLLVLLTPTLALAKEPAPSLRRSIENVDFQGLGLPVRPPRASAQRQTPVQGKTQRRIVYGIAGAVVGSLAGALIGGSLNRNCGCDDPGLTGVVIGLPIGAIAGAVMGVIVASR